MKALIYLLLVIGLLSTCKSVEIFTPTCTNVVLKKVDWTYCNPNNFRKCENHNDTLIRKTIIIVENITGVIDYTPTSGYCIVIDKSENLPFLSFTAFNLPDCFKKDKLKVKFSGIAKEHYLDTACGPAFELTKIQDIP